MRKCTYCGRENADDAIHCYECGTQFGSLSNLTAKAKPVLAVDTSLAQPATLADENWSARAAWKCLGMFVVFVFLMGLTRTAIEAEFPGFRLWSRSGAAHLVFSVVYYSIEILTVLYFARTNSVRSFLEAFGLARSPSSYVWFAVVLTLVIRWTGHVALRAGWATGVTSSSLWGFTHSVGLERYLFLAPALMAPFGEELYMRGFFYRAFRRSYSTALSVVLILGITGVTHWGQVHRSWVAAVEIGALTLLQCFLRERTGNLWDRVLCHLVFNITAALAPFLVR